MFQDNSKLQPFDDFNRSISSGDSNNELPQVIKKLEAMMVSLGHALYKGDIYVKPPFAKFTYVLMMSVESYINPISTAGGGGVFSTPCPVNGSELHNGAS